MFGRLAFILLPYALVVGCLVLLGVAATVIANGAETAPTDVPLAQLSKASPTADWLHVADGSLFMPGVVADTKRGKYTRKETPKAYYVPLVTPAHAMRYAAGDAPAGGAVFVKFSRGEFESRFPDYSFEAPVGDALVPLDVRGTRSGDFSFSSQFKTYLRDELKLEPASVTLIDFDDHPMQRGEAAGLAGVAVVVAVGSVFWIKKRWQQPAVAA